MHLVYWRFDEGKGSTVNDMSDSQINGVMTHDIEWSQETLEDGQPLEYEDKWGKSNQPSFSVSLSNNDGITASLPRNAIEKFKLNNNFTLEFWLNPKSLNGQLTLLKTDNFTVTFVKGN